HDGQRPDEARRHRHAELQKLWPVLSRPLVPETRGLPGVAAQDGGAAAGAGLGHLQLGRRDLRAHEAGGRAAPKGPPP
ncbi:unnamed protein product, partial [Effrenium voratum]